MATEDDFAHIWYADGNGNVTGYVVNGGDKASTIIDAYNEHFGTDISIWTSEKKSLQVGDTVPNWNAYEKIETTIYIKAVYDQSNFTFGYLSNNGVFHWQMFSESFAKLANAEGVVQTTMIQQAQDYWENILKAKLQERWNVQSYVVEVDTTLNPGATVPNWQKYEIIE